MTRQTGHACQCLSPGGLICDGKEADPLQTHLFLANLDVGVDPQARPVLAVLFTLCIAMRPDSLLHAPAAFHVSQALSVCCAELLSVSGFAWRMSRVTSELAYHSKSIVCNMAAAKRTNSAWQDHQGHLTWHIRMRNQMRFPAAHIFKIL